MQHVENKEDSGITVVVDDKHFINCRYRNCTMVYSGGDFSWTNSTFENCQFRLEGAAQRTAALMGQLGIMPPKPMQPPPPSQASGGPVN